jgi:hypothetical protein
MNVKDEFFYRGYFKVGSRRLVWFREDTYLGESSLARRYPSLYNFVAHKAVSVYSGLSNVPLNVWFWRLLDGTKWNTWLHLCSRIMHINLNNEPDRFVWKLTSSRLFMVKSMYEDLMNSHDHFSSKYLWKLKIPLKIKIFMWFLNR